jgi:hypothetical protein
MAVELTQAHIAHIQPDHTIVLPEEMPVGATVAVIVLPVPVAPPDEEAARRARFEATLAAIRAAMSESAAPPPSEAELEALIEKARHTPSA